MKMKDGYTKADTDGLYYKNEDTCWGVPPDHDAGDPGWITPKSGAVPVSAEEATITEASVCKPSGI